MKIIELRAENFKRLKAVTISPDGTLQVIAGRNAQGKTSVLDAIWLALGGGQAARSTTRPVRDGESKAEVRLDLGDMVVTRTWTAPEGKTTLKVESGDGFRASSPQTLLDGLIGRLSFDPLAFANMDERAQTTTLLGLIDLPFDLDEIAARRASLFERRTDENRRLKMLQAQVDLLPEPPADLPDEEISVSQMVAEVDDATSAHNELRDARQQAKDARLRVMNLEQDLANARATFASAAERVNDLESADLPDLGAVVARMESADITNAAIRAAKQRRELVAQCKAALTVSTDLSDQILALDDKKASAIRDANMPVPGLGFDDDGVTFNGVPFRQCSAAERLRVSMAIAMADNPKLRVIRITDGSLLDTENLALIEQMAQAADFQVWIERVDETGGVGVLIEDGEVA
jgi:DNA repair exonuclease SbcCD ATPase subunit